MATLEPEREMKEESTAPYSSPPDPATLDVLSDQFMDFPEAPDANPPSSENIFPILFSPPCSPLMPPGPVCYVSPAHISPTLSQSSSPMSALVCEYNPLLLTPISLQMKLFKGLSNRLRPLEILLQLKNTLLSLAFVLGFISKRAAPSLTECC